MRGGVAGFVPVTSGRAGDKGLIKAEAIGSLNLTTLVSGLHVLSCRGCCCSLDEMDVVTEPGRYLVIKCSRTHIPLLEAASVDQYCCVVWSIDG